MLRLLTAMTSRAPPIYIVPIPKNGVSYRQCIVLAPMVRSGELPSRLLALKYGASLVWGPETVDRSMIGTTRRINPRTSCVEFTRWSSNGGRADQPLKESVIYRIDPSRERGKLVFQIGTASPELAVQAAKLVAGDVAGIDVNAGCPKPFSTSGGMGAALLRIPDRLATILEALVKEVGKVWEIGISVKIRLLETPEKTEALVRKLCGTGITGLTVHCRTTPMRPRERAIREQLRMIGNVCREMGVACLMNGDVSSRDHALDLIKEYNVDGAMIATAAEKNPSCFLTAEQGGLIHWREVAKEYMRLAMEVENKWGNTKFVLSQIIPGKDACYVKATQSKSYAHCVDVMGFEELKGMATGVDASLGMGDPQRLERAVKDEDSGKPAVFSMRTGHDVTGGELESIALA
jgi:tRNA-dihydrouridine synthase 2